MRRNIIIFVNTFIFSVLIWFYINMNLTYSHVINVPLEVTYSKNQAISSELPSNVEITIKAKGWELISIMLMKEPKYLLDVSGYKKDGSIYLSQNAVDALQFPSGVIVQNVDPDIIEFTFDNIITKYVKVEANTVVNTKTGYIVVGSPRIVPDSVKLTGARSVISKIKYLSTIYREFNGIGSSFSRDIEIQDTLANLIKVEPKVVNVFYRIELYAEKTFEDVEVSVRNVPEDKEVLIVPPKIKVSLRGGVEQLSKLFSSDIKALIDYSQIVSDEQGYVVPRLELPENLNVIQLEPEEFQYIVKKKSADN